MVVVMRDFVVVQVVWKQRPYMNVAVSGLPAGVVMIDHGPQTWQQSDSRHGSGPADPRNQSPYGRKSHDGIIADGKGLP